jgi:hypothetical protein
MQKKITTLEFLKDSTQTGRFTVKSTRTGRTYYIEPQGDPHIEWGSVDQSSGKMNVKKGWKRNMGSTEKDESLITEDNGFKNITTLRAGMSPLAYIESIDSQY